MVMKLILAAAFVWAALIPCKRALHMFQQNRYEVKRYFKWMKSSWAINAASAALPLILCVIAAVCGLFLKGIVRDVVLCVLMALNGAYLWGAESEKNYIKPLVYTARVKRQIAVMAVLAALCLFVFLKSDLAFLLPAGSFLLPWLLIYLMAWITMPVEAMVRQRYINEARKILADHKDLIRIGITGSFGKTSTKNIMQSMLSEQYNSLMTPASYNTPLGITRTIREMLKPIHKVFVCEMGADHVGEITYLMNFVHPSIGLVTSIGPQHLNTFGSQENIIHEKMQMIELLPSDGFGILNYDNDFIRNYKVQNNVETVTYGIRSKDVDYRAEDIVYSPTGSSFTVVHGDERVHIETKLLGELNILNILSAIACARHLNVSWNVIQRAAKQMKQVEHRLEMRNINGYRFIDDAFNSNPVGSAMALEVLSMMPNTRVIVTPGMIDLGEKQAEYNKAFGEKMKDKADIVILVGENQTKPIVEGLEASGFDMNNVHVMNTVKEAFAYVYQHCTPKDTILLENDLPDAFSH
ncbi:MAG: UDP-N-acetylmuramoyl-tripeptide--D-alanyl-D-alanine ligase [Solobacterium sp.]|nr:UDP-N-acetylmuramoyl-tripeptide--D-alanyl-D-alanine ligase [Solobacterium sp.]